ncbi:uncharacterized protein LOC106082549 [Stomoxys calcitrans]|uniref:uncharacterized protein LOC106082549 n=1 Tax=Stomoxys calcitrans TaxID=35570 RepID=UPI0027E21EC0|nr:uncharacterized protein LOC106082549 [Stomoxys calcitrans]
MYLQMHTQQQQPQHHSTIWQRTTKPWRHTLWLCLACITRNGSSHRHAAQDLVKKNRSFSSIKWIMMMMMVVTMAAGGDGVRGGVANVVLAKIKDIKKIYTLGYKGNKGNNSP